MGIYFEGWTNRENLAPAERPFGRYVLHKGLPLAAGLKKEEPDFRPKDGVRKENLRLALVMLEENSWSRVNSCGEKNKARSGVPSVKEIALGRRWNIDKQGVYRRIKGDGVSGLLRGPEKGKPAAPGVTNALRRLCSMGGT